jgi:hypothetical protein
MEALDNLRNRIKNLEDRELYTYSAALFGAILLLLALLTFVHYRKVSYYREELKRVDTQRAETKKILSNYKIAKAHSQKVEEILAQNKDFRIGEAFQDIIQRVGLSGRLQNQIVPTIGEAVSGKTEFQVIAQFSRLSMKNVTDLLMAIAAVPQLYTKEVTIKKENGSPAVDLDITIATLELSTNE